MSALAAPSPAPSAGPVPSAAPTNWSKVWAAEQASMVSVLHTMGQHRPAPKQIAGPVPAGKPAPKPAPKPQAHPAIKPQPRPHPNPKITRIGAVDPQCPHSLADDPECREPPCVYYATHPDVHAKRNVDLIGDESELHSEIKAEGEAEGGLEGESNADARTKMIVERAPTPTDWNRIWASEEASMAAAQSHIIAKQSKSLAALHHSHHPTATGKSYHKPIPTSASAKPKPKSKPTHHPAKSAAPKPHPKPAATHRPHPAPTTLHMRPHPQPKMIPHKRPVYGEPNHWSADNVDDGKGPYPTSKTKDPVWLANLKGWNRECYQGTGWKNLCSMYAPGTDTSTIVHHD